MGSNATLSRPRTGRPLNGAIFATFSLCILASLADGFDIQAAGIAATKYKAEFHFSTEQLSAVFVANSCGLLVGALVGGWLADRIGRRWVMIGSMLLFGVCSLVTALLSSGSLFAELRFCTGIGLGAAVANIIALVAEAGESRSRATRVTVLTASNPLGGAIAAGLVSIDPDMNWRTIFEIGGWWPIAIAGAMLLWLPESAGFMQQREGRAKGDPNVAAMPAFAALFGEGRALASVMLWIGFFFCVLAIHLIVSWLPSLLVGQNYTIRQAATAACLFPLGGGIGTALLGILMGRLRRKAVMVFSFSGLAIFVGALALAPHNLPIMYSAAFLSGFFVIGSQFLLYGLSPTYYPLRARGTGVGTAVAMGRLGSIAGPMMAGLLLGAGRPPAQVLMSILPGVVFALIAALVLTSVPTVED